MHPHDYQVIAGVGIIIDFIAFILLVVYPLSDLNDPAVLIIFFVSLLCFLAFTGLLHFGARILKIENITLLVSMFIAFTSFISFLVALYADFLGPYLNPFELDRGAMYEKYTDPVYYFEIYRRVSIAFATGIMWIMTVGMAKFMYRTKLSKALLVSIPLPLLVVAFCFFLFL